jgi:hypothetical protein
MKPTFYLSAVLAVTSVSHASDAYINQIVETDVGTGLMLGAPASGIADYGTKDADSAVPEGGVKYELFTMLATSPYTEYLLDSKSVGAYFPATSLTVSTEDPYTVIPRTRADQPITVTVTLSGLLSGASDPDASKSVNFLHHIQSYGDGGTGIGINRDNATLLTTESIAENGDKTFTYSVTSIPSADLSKTRGEERFSVYSLDHTVVGASATYNAPASLLASKYVQIWPVAEGSISGITSGQKVLFALPQVTLTYKDLYPSSTTYAQVYKGSQSLGTVGVVVPGSAKTYAETVPQDATLTLTNWDSVFDADGTWTLEVVTVTPFNSGNPERLAYVTFDLDRTIEVNSNITTSD